LRSSVTGISDRIIGGIIVVAGYNFVPVLYVL
jgi:hypothetical protein